MICRMMIYKYFALAFLSFVSYLRPTLSLECNFGITHTVNHFDEYGFLGTWHETERTTLILGDRTLDSTTWVFKHGPDGQLYMAYTGFSPQSRSCTGSKTVLLKREGPGASYQLIDEGRNTAYFQITYTDYKSMALVYMCFEPERSGTCDRSRVHVSLLSRTPSLSNAHRTVLMAHLDLAACMEDRYFARANTGLCQAPVPLIPVGR